MQNHKAWGSSRDTHNLRASSPIWASETGLASQRRSSSLARSREARFTCPNRRACLRATILTDSNIQEVNQISLNHNNNTSKGKEGGRKVYKEKFQRQLLLLPGCSRIHISPIVHRNIVLENKGNVEQEIWERDFGPRAISKCRWW